MNESTYCIIYIILRTEIMHIFEPARNKLNMGVFQGKTVGSSSTKVSPRLDLT